MRSIRRRSVALLTLALYLAGCSFPATRDFLPAKDIPKIDKKAPYLRLHYKDGRLAVLNTWLITDAYGTRLVPKKKPKGAMLVSTEAPVEATHAWVSGNGTLYDASRDVLRAGDLRVAIDSLALAESNVAHPNTLGTLLLAITVIIFAALISIALICALDPKACFGSCPTFYVTDGTHDVLAAEGFSASVAPGLEATDVDALFHAQPQGRRVDITMANEAYETHVVRSVTLLAAPRARGTRVFRSRTGEYWQGRVVGGPLHAMAAEGDVAPSLREFDGAERFSRADSTDLATRETIELEFPRTDGEELGIAIACRQSLLTTFLFYQTLAYMGTRAADWIARVERADSTFRAQGSRVGDVLGGIEVQRRDRFGRWSTIQEIRETGPLATDVHFVRLPAGTTSDTPLRLRLTRGHWRLDWVALVRLERRVEPLRLSPAVVTRDSVADDDARLALTGRGDPLVTIRGDRVGMRFDLPEPASHYELFLESRGYYLEWMRQEWLAEENQALALRMFVDPRGSLRRLAPEYAGRETRMEESFWGSRYARP
jgi:hypothetical protein